MPKEAQPLLFIQVTNPEDLVATQTRKQIRRHVMKHATRAKRQKAAEEDNTLVSQQSWLPSIPYFVPPIQWRFYMPAFLNNWMTCKKMSSRTENSIHAAQGMWLEKATRNPAMLHAILAMSAAYHHKLSYERLQQVAWYHIGQAIVEINKALTDTFTAVSDEIFLAVVAVASFENLRGNSHACRTHLSGLQSMVNARGGLHTMSMLVKHSIHWIDGSYATAAASKPVFPLQASDFESAGLKTVLIPDSAGNCLNPQLHGIILQLRKLGSIVDSSYSSTVTLNEMWEFVTLRTHVDIELLSMPLVILPYSQSSEYVVGTVAEVVRLGALIYLNLVCRCVSTHSRVHRSLSGRLAQSVQRLQGGMVRCMPENLSILLWAVVLGGGASTEAAGRTTLGSFFQELIPYMGVTSWVDCRSVMENVTYSDRGCGEVCEAFYTEATAASNLEAKD
ncbi:hypothetical protein VTL71DRAFT_6208 [Oculimacula yallundae]|uniref:Uncharacterized protein n=1 Tax=Oculimacula yallundae TaxID=86028 RepID=A0ABR4C174_9HELO